MNTTDSLAAAIPPIAREGGAHPEMTRTPLAAPRDVLQPAGRPVWGYVMSDIKTTSSPVTSSGVEAAHPDLSRDDDPAGSGCASNVP